MISKHLIKHVAKIARIELKETEIDKFTGQMKDILEVFKTLKKTNTKNVEPSFQPLEIKNIWREDKTEKCKWKPLSNAENKKDHYFKGPRAV